MSMNIIIEDAHFDEDGAWWAEGKIDGIGFEGVAPEPTEKGFGRFDWWTDQPLLLAEEEKAWFRMLLMEAFKQTKPHPMMLIERELYKS